MRNRRLANAVLVVALAGIGLTVIALGRTPASAPAVSSANTPCSARAQAVIGPGDLKGSFLVMGNDFQPRGPVGLGSNQVFRTYDGGRLTGLLASVALAGKYKAEQDARARALNYMPGRWPLLPLQGAVVVDNPGPLEVYQANWHFGSTADAQAFYADDVASLTGTHGSELFSVVGIPEAVEASGWTFPASRPETEESIDIDFRVGSAVIQLAVRGGNAISPKYVLSVATVASTKLKGACSSRS